MTRPMEVSDRRSLKLPLAWKRGTFTLLLVLSIVGCSDGFFHTPAAPDGISVTLAYRLPAAGAAGGSSEAFDQVTRLRLTVVSASTSETLLDSVEPFEADGAETTVSVPVEIEGGSEDVTLAVVLLSPEGPVFSGQSSVTLTRGQSSSADVPLEGIAAGLRIDQDLPVMTAIGQTQTVGGVTIFATGDTLGPVPITLQSLDPTVVTTSGSQITSVGEGVADLTGSFGALSDQTQVTVSLEVVSVDVNPTTETVRIGGEAIFTATPLDGNGNPIAGRATEWFSANPGVATVDATGVATGRGLGTTEILAQVDGVTGAGEIIVFADPPSVFTGPATNVQVDRAQVNGRVNPGGAVTTAWFEWDTDPAFSEPTATTPINVGGGTESVDLSETISGLVPQTLHYFRVVAENEVGSATSDAAFFATPPRAPTQLTATPLNFDTAFPLILVSWFLDEGPVEFFLERRLKSEPFELIATTEARSHVDTGLYDVEHSYRVRACFEGSCSEFSNVATVIP